MVRDSRALSFIIRVRMAATSARLMGESGLKQCSTPSLVLPTTTPAR